MFRAGLTVNIIGAGKVGRTLARLIHEQRMATISQVVCLRPERAEAACELIGQGSPARLSEVMPADIHFITTKDADIASVCNTLVEQEAIRPGSVVVHCSGVLTSEVLASAKERGAWVCSLHPLKAFPKIKQALKTMPGTPWVMEGDDLAVALLRSWVSTWGGVVRIIDPAFKPAYHAACVLVGAGLTTLYDAGSQLLASCGFSREDINQMLSAYLQTVLTNNVELGSQQALTGPVVRQDWETIALHRETIAQLRPNIQALYDQILDDSNLLAKQEIDFAPFIKGTGA